METVARAQTVIRLPESLMVRVKYKARQKNMSVNAYIEEVLQQAVRPQIPKLPKDFKLSETIERLSGICPAPTKEMLEQDDRMAYIWNKGRECQ